MFFSSKPDKPQIELFIAEQKNSDLTYTEVGVTETNSYPFWNRDHNRTLIGNGDRTYKSAYAAIQTWKMFDIPWIELHANSTFICKDLNVAILVHHLGFWSLNAARIVYIIQESERFGFAYGTLQEHGEMGEERFSVDINPSTGDVHYDILAVSRPRHLMAMLGYPYTRYLQKCFALESMLAMKRSVG